ncbi:MAG TPA: PQQ-dependent sugar dehydrogenase [Abditibacteriaceae bacterium]|nr:PQQ-dependent sugar dehydrogenase [Abditibacteriaceae bacterium]
MNRFQKRTSRSGRVLAAGAVLAGVVLSGPAMAPAARAATLPPGFREFRITDGLNAPTAMAFAPDERLFVCEQAGSLRVIKNNALLATPFLTVDVDDGGERGLLGVAFDPGFAINRYVYIYYTVPGTPAHNRVSRFTANGDVAVPGSEQIILELNALSSAHNHNGGALHFGRDGKLYIGVGENANGANAQTLTNLLGKILRINKSGTIPGDNPFYATASGQNRAIWALGLRNPFTFAVQRGTGRIFINDVGASSWEEINDGQAGANYGWPVTEGPTTDPRFKSPLSAYGHGTSSTTGCAIAGGAFYNPYRMQFPAGYAGDYFFADLCGGWIRRLDVATKRTSLFATRIASPVDLKVSRGGALWYLARGTGSVYKIRYFAPSNTISALTVSSVAASAAGGSIHLIFDGSLDADVATDPTRYAVEVDGQFVAVSRVSYRAATSAITLSLPDGVLHRGHEVVVSWSGLLDTHGSSLSGRTGTVLVE